MKSDIIKYAIVSALLEERKNYLDIYYPFVLRCFNEDNCNSLAEIHNSLKELFTVELPINSIKDLISRYNKKTFVARKKSKSDWEIDLTKEGRSELNELLESEGKAEIKINSFYNAFSDYLKSNGYSDYSIEEIKKLTNQFISKNLFKISVTNNSSSEYEIFEEEDQFEKYIIFFLSEIKGSRLDLVEVFDEIWKGTVIWNEIQKRDLKTSIASLEKQLIVYVDTNFILSLLELHHPIVNQAAIELYDLLIKVKNIELVVLDATLQETWDLLSIYQFVKDDFFDIEVDSVFYYLKKKKYTIAKVEELRDKLKEKLSEKFKIKFDEAKVLTEREQLWYADIYNHLHDIRKNINKKRGSRKKSEEAIEKNSQHDASVITEVLRYKDRYSTNLENSKGIFLTSSFWLFQNYKKIYNQFEKFPSVILDVTLTNILFLKQPNSNPGLSIDQVIKAHSKYLLVNRNVWMTYVDELKRLFVEEKITPEDYSRLITKNQVTNSFLLNSTPESISRDSVLSILEEIKSSEVDKEKELKKYSEISKRLNLQNLKLVEDNKSKSDAIKKLQEEVQSLKNRNARKDYESALNGYEESLKRFINEKITNKRKEYSVSRLSYSIFILLSIIVFVFNGYLINLLFSGENTHIYLISIILAVILFIIPFIRSFIKHEKVLEAFRVIASKKFKRKRIEELKSIYKEEFEQGNDKPDFEDFKS